MALCVWLLECARCHQCVLVCTRCLGGRRYCDPCREQAREESIRSEKLATVGRLSAGIAHEIGNPLVHETSEEIERVRTSSKVYNGRAGVKRATANALP